MNINAVVALDILIAERVHQFNVSLAYFWSPKLVTNHTCRHNKFLLDEFHIVKL